MAAPRRSPTTSCRGGATAALALAAAFVAAPALAAPYTWFGGTGDWYAPANWTPGGVPGAADGATIAAGQVALGTSTHVDALTLTGRMHGAGVLSADALTLLGGGFERPEGSGGITVVGRAVIAGNAHAQFDDGAALTLLGASTWAAGTGVLAGSDGGRIVIGSTGVLQDEGAVDGGVKAFSAGDGLGRFENLGRYEHSGAGTTSLARFVNRGAVNVLEGRLDIRGSRSSNQGTITVGDATLGFEGTNLGRIDVAEGGTLQFGTGGYWLVQQGGTVGNRGLVRLLADNVEQSGAIEGGTVLVGGSGIFRNDGRIDAQVLRVEGGMLGGTGDTVAEDLRFLGGTLGNSDRPEDHAYITVTGRAKFAGDVDLSVRRATLTLAGTSLWQVGAGNLALGDGSLLRITAGGTFQDEGTAAAGGQRGLFVGSDEGRAVNDGLYLRRGLGTTRALAFRNNGTLRIESGGFHALGGFHNAGSVELGADGTLYFSDRDDEVWGRFAGLGRIDTLGDDLWFMGQVDPGSADAFGTLSVLGHAGIGDSGELRLDLRSAAAHDAFAVSGDLQLLGGLSLSAAPTVDLGVGDIVTLATAGGTLDASAWHGLVLHGFERYRFETLLDAHTLRLCVTGVDVVTPPVPTPAPATSGLLALGVLLALRGRVDSTCRAR